MLSDSSIRYLVSIKMREDAEGGGRVSNYIYITLLFYVVQNVASLMF